MPDQVTTSTGRRLAAATFLDYWLAYQLRFLALRARWTRPRPFSGAWPDACRRVASGEQVSPRDRVRAQVYATRIWFRCMMAAVILFIVSEFLALPFPLGPSRDLVARIGLTWLFAAVIAGAQMGCASWRLGWTRRHVLRADRGLDTPDYLLRWGMPHRRDFWLMLVLAVAFTAGVGWLSTH